MAKKVTVIDAAGVERTVRSVDAREIEAIAKGKPVEVPVPEEVVGDPAAFPKDFPGAKALTAESIGHHQALRMTKDELVAVKGIGEATAEEILKLRK